MAKDLDQLNEMGVCSTHTGDSIRMRRVPHRDAAVEQPGAVRGRHHQRDWYLILPFIPATSDRTVSRIEWTL